MKGVNRVTIIGTLGNDPDVKWTQGGQCICNLSVATNETWKDKEGNKQERTSWHRIKLWGKLGEIAGEYLRKGSAAYFEGRLEYGSYEKEGVKHYTTDIVADQMQMLGGNPSQQGNTSSTGQRGGAPQRQRPNQAKQPADDFADDDIPFLTNRHNW